MAPLLPRTTSIGPNMSEKEDVKEVGVTRSSSREDAPSDVDDAWKYLNAHRDSDAVNRVDLAKLRRKIDWHIVPLMFLAYTYDSRPVPHELVSCC